VVIVDLGDLTYSPHVQFSIDQYSVDQFSVPKSESRIDFLSQKSEIRGCGVHRKTEKNCRFSFVEN
jgi:hypothetical protein